VTACCNVPKSTIADAAISSCKEEKNAAWSLNLNLQSSFRIEQTFGSKLLTNSNCLKLLFYGPHARDSCKVKIIVTLSFSLLLILLILTAAGVGCGDPPRGAGTIQFLLNHVYDINLNQLMQCRSPPTAGQGVLQAVFCCSDFDAENFRWEQQVRSKVFELGVAWSTNDELKELMQSNGANRVESQQICALCHSIHE
jgi:hypothetical protein